MLLVDKSPCAANAVCAPKAFGETTCLRDSGRPAVCMTLGSKGATENSYGNTTLYEE